MQQTQVMDPWVGKIPRRRKWHPTPAFLPGKSRGQRSLVGYSPWGCKESDTTETSLSLAFLGREFISFIPLPKPPVITPYKA